MLKRIFLAAVVLVLMSTHNYAQTRRTRVYSGYYNGYEYIPGLSVYSNGTYSYDYNGSRTNYHFGYRPPVRRRRVYVQYPDYYIGGVNIYGTNPALNPYHPANGW